MHASSRRALALLLAVAASLAGCAGEGEDETVQAGGNIAPPPDAANRTSPQAHFEVVGLVVLARDGEARPLYEDDAGAIVRYAVRQPPDAPSAEAAFVSYLVNGRLIHIDNLELAPGEERQYEREIRDLRQNKSLRIEVRAGASAASVDVNVLEWPRAGSDALVLGPLSIRNDYGLAERDGRVLANITVTHVGLEGPLHDFRVKMLCADDAGAVEPTGSVRLPAPEAGNTTSVEVLLEDCSAYRYGLEFKGRNATSELMGRLLLVPRGWAPPQASGT